MPLCFFTKVHFYDHNGKCACGRRATQDENLKEKKMTQDIRVGDKIRATLRAGEVELTGTVSNVTEGNKFAGTQVVNLGGFTIGTATWEVEVTERPIQLPTEDGLYTIANTSVAAGSIRSFGLYAGEWFEYGKDGRIEEDRLIALMNTYGWTLKRLVIEGEVTA